MTETPNDPSSLSPDDDPSSEVSGDGSPPEALDDGPSPETLDEGVDAEALDVDASGAMAETADAADSGDEVADEADIEAQMLGMLDVASEPTPAADFAEFSGAGAEGDPAALSLLFDLSLPVAVELGRTRMSVQEVLALGRGSVVQLDRLAGEPIDVFVGDRRFAEGEVVVLGEQFGIRITRVISGVSSTMAEA